MKCPSSSIDYVNRFLCFVLPKCILYLWLGNLLTRNHTSCIPRDHSLPATVPSHIFIKSINCLFGWQNALGHMLSVITSISSVKRDRVFLKLFYSTNILTKRNDVLTWDICVQKTQPNANVCCFSSPCEFGIQTVSSLVEVKSSVR